ncbi:MAG: hypothetical protein ACHQ16_03110 [Candidatus Lutacidiplasmatales archaeon]
MTSRFLPSIVLVLFAVALMAISPVAFVGSGHGSATRIGAPSIPSLSHPAAPAVSSPDATVSAHGALPATQPASATCNTPQNAPRWNSLFFFNDVEVSFYVPHSPALDGGGFQFAPCTNNLPTYLNGFWMNVTTNVAMINAVVTMWGTSWPNATVPQPAIKGFDPLAPTNVSMYIPNGARTTAHFYFDLYRYFWPGSHVYFNLTIESAGATPSTIYSANPTTGDSAQFNDSGLIDNYTWQFYVQSIWGSTDFASDIGVSTTPSVLTTPAFSPNRHQNLTITLTSLTTYNGTLQGIGHATLGIKETVNNITQPYSEPFGPPNGTTVSVVVPANPGANGTFNISAYLPWRNGAIDTIQSSTYKFNWTSKGGWWYPTLGLVRNLNLTTTPNVLSTGATKTTLPTGTEVNVTIHSPIQNVTLGAAQIHVHYSDAAGSAEGVIPMIKVDQNTSYGLIPGLPTGGTVAFYVIAKDLFGTPISSGNTTYTETGAPQAGPGGITLATGYGLFFFEAVDLTTGRLITYLNYTITNATWSETRQGTPLGFAAPTPLAGTGFLPVTYGTYVIVVHAFNETETATVNVGSATPFDVVFYVASGAVEQNSWVQQTTLTIPAVLGLVGASAAVWPIGQWFRERRQKAEQEQRRITL